MFGSHLSTAGGLANALERARALKMDCVQVFTRNQRQWRGPPLARETREAWWDALRDLAWQPPAQWRGRRDRGRLVSHNSYLINMASPDEDLWQRSIEAQRSEIERCEALGIALCVAHPGAHRLATRPAGEPNRLGEAPTDDERAGLARIVTALDSIHRNLPGYGTITCLETTVGSGTNLGYDFQHLAWIRQHVAEPERVGFCFDTCHVTAAGYDMSSDRKARAVLRLFDEICGLEHLRVFHLNDSVGAVGSRRDRHAHIGQGACGRSCFRIIVNRRAFADVPKILETPKGDNDRGIPWDTVNLRRLKRLIRPPAASR